MHRNLLSLSRRSLVGGSLGTALAAAQLNWPLWMPRLAFAKNNEGGRKGDVLVCIFLRGGADGLNIIVPYAEDTYYNARPGLALARPDDAKADSKNKVLDLDGFFGLHPALAPLHPFFRGQQALAVHAAGSPDPTRSHFEAMDYMERGTPGSVALNTGWIGRHLAALDSTPQGILRAVGWGDSLPLSLRGSVNALALRSIIDYHLQGREENSAQMATAINTLYAADHSVLRSAAQETQAVMDVVTKINVSSYKPRPGVTYDPNNDFALALMQTAALIKADVGLEVSAIDLGGWDTHQNQAQDQATAISALSNGLAAFATDMSDLLSKVTVVVLSEFGRRVGENASGGTDHGHGNMLLLLGGNLINKPVVARWPGMADDKLDNGDLAVTIDYRDILGEVVSKRLKNKHLDVVFPGHTLQPVGVIKE